MGGGGVESPRYEVRQFLKYGGDSLEKGSMEEPRPITDGKSRQIFVSILKNDQKTFIEKDKNYNGMDKLL